MEPSPLPAQARPRHAVLQIALATALGAAVLASIVISAYVLIRNLGGAVTRGTMFVVTIGSDLAPGGPGAARETGEARAIFGERIGSLGVRFSIEAAGTGRLVVKVPVLEPDRLAAVRRILAADGRIEFRAVRPDPLSKPGSSNDLPPGYELLSFASGTAGKTWSEELCVKRLPEMTGETINQVSATLDEYGRHRVTLQFTFEGARRFSEMTRQLVLEGETSGQTPRLAIVIDGVVCAAPVIQGVIDGGRVEITGLDTAEEAAELAAVLTSPLPFAHRIVEERAFAPFEPAGAL